MITGKIIALSWDKEAHFPVTIKKNCFLFTNNFLAEIMTGAESGDTVRFTQ